MPTFQNLMGAGLLTLALVAAAVGHFRSSFEYAGAQEPLRAVAVVMATPGYGPLPSAAPMGPFAAPTPTPALADIAAPSPAPTASPSSSTSVPVVRSPSPKAAAKAAPSPTTQPVASPAQAALPSPTPKAPVFSTTGITVDGVIGLTNQRRQENRLSDLRENAKLDQAATVRAQDMLTYQYFAHESPVGVNDKEIAATNAGYAPWSLLAENIAYGSVGAFNDEVVMQKWMESEGHRKNILHPDVKDIGVGVVRGDYLGGPVWFVVQLFGTLQ